MATNNKSKLLVFLSVFTAGVMLLPVLLLSSCGKAGNINPTEAKIQYQVVNLSYDILPVNLYINLIKQNTSVFSYPNASGYIGLTTITPPFQIRSATTTTVTNLLTIDSTHLSNDTKYTVFITGTRVDSALTYIFAVDTSTTPQIGRGKIRFVNASIPVTGTTAGLYLTANDTIAFTRQKYKAITDYIDISAGIYNFKIRSSATQVLKELPNTTVEDGHLYTIYTYGVPFRTDTAAFGAGILTNR